MQDKPQTFTIQGRLPSLNEYTRACRAHWSKGAQLKRQVEADIMWQLQAARLAHKVGKAAGPVIISLEWHDSNRRRDIDNVFFGVKFILDAMQKLEIIANDDRKHVVGLNHSIVDDDQDFVVVTIQAAA